MSVEGECSEEWTVGGPSPLRPFGLCAGEFTAPDDFDASLPEDMIRWFEGNEGLT
ncbi:MAG: hypothetical protein AB1801_07615 [Chloroflexota bacterium]